MHSQIESCKNMVCSCRQHRMSSNTISRGSNAQQVMHCFLCCRAHNVNIIINVGCNTDMHLCAATSQTAA